MNASNDRSSEDPQEERGAPGSRDTGSDEPSGGPTNRPSGTYRGDETVPAHDESGAPSDTGSSKTEMPPSDAEPAVPPYEGRQTTAKPDDGAEDDGSARTGGAVKPVTDTEHQSASPASTPGGATTSPADEQPAAQMPESDRDDGGVGPAHTPGTGRGEQKR